MGKYNESLIILAEFVMVCFIIDEFHTSSHVGAVMNRVTVHTHVRSLVNTCVHFCDVRSRNHQFVGSSSLLVSFSPGILSWNFVMASLKNFERWSLNTAILKKIKLSHINLKTLCENRGNK